MRRRNKVVDYLAYLAVRAFELKLRLMPVRMMYALAGFLGWVWWKIDRRHGRIAMGHLRLSFPDWPESRVRAVARESFASMAYLAVEVLRMPYLVRAGNWTDRITTVNPQQTFELAAAKTGLIMLTGHFGNWELLGYILALAGLPSHALARPFENPYLNRRLLAIRQRTGLHVLDKHGAAREVYRLLEAGATVGFIADQDAGPRGEFVDFFGRPASTYKIVAQAAMRYNVPVIIGYARRLGRDFRFEAGCERIIYPREWVGQADPVAWITREYTAAMEQIVRRNPEQYFWTHRRWRTRPDGAKAPGDGVA